MNAASLITALRLQRSQWSDPARVVAARDRSLRRLIAHACSTVPYYRQLFHDAGIAPGDIRCAADLAAVPVTTKSTLQRHPREHITSDAIAAADCVEERTSGSTGEPFVTRLDRHFVQVRNALFLRVLTTAGYRPGQRLMLVTAAADRRARWPGWRYASLTESPARLLEALESHQPHVLYGCMTPLRQMARHARSAGLVTHRPRAIVSTAESLDSVTRRLLERSFRCPVFDSYGLTEMGMVAWECARHDGYHVAEDTAIVEITAGEDADPGRLVMTNLALRAMPLIRFATGDLAAQGDTAPCRCGRRLSRLARIEGRSVDSVQLADHSQVSPYRLTLALERVEGIERYQLVQHAIGRFTLRYEGPAEIAAGAVRRALDPIVGPGARIALSREADLDPPPGRKFRVIDCRLPDRSAGPPVPGPE